MRGIYFYSLDSLTPLYLTGTGIDNLNIVNVNPQKMEIRNLPKLGIFSKTTKKYKNFGYLVSKTDKEATLLINGNQEKICLETYELKTISL